jgi:transcriptional regulator with GAF, ATPase, and Fis domain
MSGIPSRDNLSAIAASTAGIGPGVAFGLCRAIDDSRASLVLCYGQGLSEWVLAQDRLPSALQLTGGDPRQSAVSALAEPAIEQFLRDVGAARMASAWVPAASQPPRLWMAVSDAQPFTEEQLAQVASAAEVAAPLLETVAEDRVEQLRRLELAARVLPTLLEVLDIRDVFDHLSKAAAPALSHDILVAVLFSDDLLTYSVFAVSGAGIQFSPNQANAYAPAVIRVYRFAIVDDLLAHPLEGKSPAMRMGGRSSIRAPIRYRDRVIGSLTFASFTPNAYTTADAPIVRRLAEQVAVGLSHYQLAEEGRQAAALRERAANLDLLDELLTTLIESDELTDVFTRVSDMASKVLRHDAAVLVVWLPDGTHGRVYASRGFPPGHPDIVEIPEDLRSNPTWAAGVVDRLSERPEPRYADLAAMGFQSLVRVPIRLEGQFAATLALLSKSSVVFGANDVAVARRIADRLAVALARDRELQASKRADAAAERASQLEARVRVLTEELDARSGFRRVVGESKEWRHVLTQATQVAATTTTVLLLGESGTGKEVLARFVHRGSARKSGPFIALNCAALPEQLLEAELFGYERGAFTGAMQSKPGQLEQASGGTLFLDEVGEMSLSSQAKFLRVLQEREFQRLGGTRVIRTDARIVAATNRDLPKEIALNKFREDLYYRLNVFALHLPPLRNRADDILPLSDAFLAELARDLGRPPGVLSSDARQMLVDYDWPGNVRELRNVLERAVILSDGGTIVPEYLAVTLTRPPAVVEPPPRPAAAAPPAGDLHSVERAMIEQALNDARFNKSKAAKALGLTRHQLYIRMRRHGFD